MFDYCEIKKSIRTLFIHRLRTLLSTLGILFGVAALMIMLSIGEGAKQETLEQIARLGINHIFIRQSIMTKNDESQVIEQQSQGLIKQDLQALSRNISAITAIAPLKVIQAKIYGKLALLSPEIIATTRDYQEMHNLQFMEGRFICDRDQKEKKWVCVLGYDVAKNLGYQGHIGQFIKIENRYYQIVGILKPTYYKTAKNHPILYRNPNQTIFIPLDSHYGLSSHSSKQNEISEAVLRINETQQMNKIVEWIKQILKKRHKGLSNYQIIVPYELLQQAYRTQLTFNWVLGSIAAISLLVGGIGIMNIMLANVSERTREIGIRRAVGANQQHILRQFLLETLLLTLGGCLLGIISGVVFSYILNFAVGWPTTITLWSILFSLGMALGIGLCSGLYPALQAAKMDPIQALRHH